MIKFTGNSLIFMVIYITLHPVNEICFTNGMTVETGRMDLGRRLKIDCLNHLLIEKIKPKAKHQESHNISH